jgi:hypothetical protein
VLWRRLPGGSSSTSPAITKLGESVAVEGPISNSFILSNSVRGADPDLLDLGVGLHRPVGVESVSITFRQCAILSKDNLIPAIEKKSSRIRLSIQDSPRNFSARRAAKWRESHHRRRCHGTYGSYGTDGTYERLQTHRSHESHWSHKSHWLGNRQALARRVCQPTHTRAAGRSAIPKARSLARPRPVPSRYRDARPPSPTCRPRPRSRF